MPTGKAVAEKHENENDQEGWLGFVALCASARTDKELHQILELFLTMEEREDLRGRYEIVKSLLRGKQSQREIASDLGVSISKITRGSNSLKTIDAALEALLRRRMKLKSG